MAKTWYGHFDSTADDEHWAKYIRSFITNGIRIGGTCLLAQVTQAGYISISPGIANIKGYIFRIEPDENGENLELIPPMEVERKNIQTCSKARPKYFRANDYSCNNYSDST